MIRTADGGRTWWVALLCLLTLAACTSSGATPTGPLAPAPANVVGFGDADASVEQVHVGVVELHNGTPELVLVTGIEAGTLPHGAGQRLEVDGLWILDDPTGADLGPLVGVSIEAPDGRTSELTTVAPSPFVLRPGHRRQVVGRFLAPSTETGAIRGFAVHYEVDGTPYVLTQDTTVVVAPAGVELTDDDWARHRPPD